MRLFQNSTMILAACFCVLVSNGLNAKIVWDKDLVFDANTNSSPLASCLNKNANGVIVMTVECSKGSFPLRGGDSILWEIGADGNTTRISPKNIDGGKVWTNAKPIGPGCAIASDNFGNLLTIGILSGQKDERKVAIISRTDKTENIMSPRNHIESHSVKKLISLQDNTFVMVGGRSDDGLCLQIDSQGKIMQEKLFDIGQAEMFTSVDRIKSDSPGLVIAGLSVKISDKAPNENFAENFIVLYGPNYSMIHEDHFMGWRSVSFLSLSLEPKVCQLDNGNIIVLYNYNKEGTAPKTRLWARCYTQELKLLWEKEIFTVDGSLLSFDVAPRNSAGFVVGMGREECLEFKFLDKDGTKIDYVQYKGTPGGVFGVIGFNLIRVNGRTIAVFEEGTAGNIRECAIKTKVIALD